MEGAGHAHPPNPAKPICGFLPCPNTSPSWAVLQNPSLGTQDSGDRHPHAPHSPSQSRKRPFVLCPTHSLQSFLARYMDWRWWFVVFFFSHSHHRCFQKSENEAWPAPASLHTKGLKFKPREPDLGLRSRCLGGCGQTLTCHRAPGEERPGEVVGGRVSPSPSPPLQELGEAGFFRHPRMANGSPPF